MEFSSQPVNPVTGLPWNPSTEVVPGGPHPGEIHAFLEMRAAEERAAKHRAEIAREVDERRRSFLLLL